MGTKKQMVKNEKELNESEEETEKKIQKRIMR